MQYQNVVFVVLVRCITSWVTRNVVPRAGEDPELTAAEDAALDAEADESADAEAAAEAASDEL